MADDNENIWFTNEELNFEHLVHLFNQNQFKAKVIDENIYVFEGFQYPVFLKLDDHSGVIRCRAKAKLKEGYYEPDFLDFLNHLNKESNCTFFFEEDEDTDVTYLVGGNFFIKSEGISYKMIVSNIIWFISFYIAGCQVDEDDEFIDDKILNIALKSNLTS